MNDELLIILIIIALLGIVMARIIKKSVNEKAEKLMIAKEAEFNSQVRKIKTYFFTKDVLDFNKFCDYVLCIKDNMSLTEYSDMVLELDMLMRFTPDLAEQFGPIILYVKEFDEISYKNFHQVQEDIREGKYPNLVKNFIYILLTTMLYLKHKVNEIRDNV